ncbi:MAG: DUF5069 domain-containing protein [Terrimicrobiaceae bacterium]|nr:DUF5069 domain-containing protein [Terrimicrobiaceae bacterium]
MNTKSNTPDLTQRPPRSPRVRLGGYVILPRMLDKCRAEIASVAGEYHYNCPMDQRFLQFTGIDPEVLKTEVARGLGDGALLAWIQANAPVKHNPIFRWSFSAWSHWSFFSSPSPPPSSAMICARRNTDEERLCSHSDSFHKS